MSKLNVAAPLLIARTHFRFVVSLLALFCVIGLSACSTPPQAKSKIDQYLNSSCASLMTRDGVPEYQYTVQSPMGRGVFAWGHDGAAQVCAYSTVRDNFYNWSDLEKLAIDRCSGRTNNRIPCQVFARNFDIVWNEQSYQSQLLRSKFVPPQPTPTSTPIVAAAPAPAPPNQQNSPDCPQTGDRSTCLEKGSGGAKDVNQAERKDESSRLSIETAKKKCAELGFKPATEGFGKCVLQLSK